MYRNSLGNKILTTTLCLCIRCANIISAIAFICLLGIFAVILPLRMDCAWAGTPDTQTILVKLREVPRRLMKLDSGSSISFGVESLDRISDSIGLREVTHLLGQCGVGIKSDLDDGNLNRWLKITISGEHELKQVIRILEDNPAVEYAQLNHIFRLDYVPNDPDVGQQWGLTKISAFEAWDIEQGAPEIIVGVIDTGIDYGHPDLGANIWVNPGEDLNQNNWADEGDFNGIDDDGNGFVDDIYGWDFTDAPNYPDGGDYFERDNDPMDELGHGTGVAGIIAGVMDNEIGIAGVAPGCRVMNLRAFTVKGNGEEDDVASAMLYAIANGAQIINMSWGDTVVSRLMDDVVRFAYERGCIMVASAGNSATNAIHYPSGNSETISVGAVDEEDFLASFSNFGAAVDVVAPGVDIYTTTLAGEYTHMQGTSFSAPFVSGIAALLLSQDGSLTAEDVKGKLIASAVDLGSSGWDSYYAAGRVDAAAALGVSDFCEAHISCPQLDQAFASGPIAICGSAWSPSLAEYVIEFGLGVDPSEWMEITRVQGQRVLDDTLAVWEEIPRDDDSYVIRLRLENHDGTRTEDKVRIFIDKTPPVITNVRMQPMLVGNRHGVLIQFSSDDLGQGCVLYRPADRQVEWQEIMLKYRTREHRLMLTQEVGAELYEVKLCVENGAGAVTSTDTSYVIDLSQPRIESSAYIQLNQTLSSGYLLNKAVDFDKDGIPEIVIGEYDDDALKQTSMFEYSGQEFARIFMTTTNVIPRDIGDSDGDVKWELLGGYGINSYLFESRIIGELPNEIVVSWEGDASTQYWASRIADLDSDGRGEIIIKVVRSSQEQSPSQFEVWETTADNTYEVAAILPNPTSGENSTGVPHCEIGDFDGDGKKEILLGDSDGDLYIYEAVDDNSFVSTWQDRMPLQDTIDFLSCGDYDGDGQLEFVAGCHTDANLNSEHEYDARHWYYRVYDTDGDNSYLPVGEWYFFGFESPKFFDSGVSSGDIDGDGRDEILICVFPDFYVIDYDTTSGAYSPSWYAWPVRSNAAIVADADHDGIVEFYLNDGQAVRAYRSLGQTTAPAAPIGIDARPLDETHVLVHWETVAGAESYAVYRGSSQTTLEKVTLQTGTVYLDSTVETGGTYWYAVTALDMDKTPNESRLSQVVEVTPGARPFVIGATAITDREVRVVFSERMGESAKNPASYRISAGVGRPTSVIHDKSGLEVVLSLNRQFSTEGNYKVYVFNVEDLDRTPIDTTRNSAKFDVKYFTTPPYIVECRLIRSNLLELTFNEPMDATTCNIATNYDLGEGIVVSNAELLELELTKVNLNLSTKVPIGALGTRYSVHVKNVKSAKGVVIRSGRGDRITLVFSRPNVSQAFVYPNPFRPGLGRDTITFANLTKSATVRIMTLSGYTIKTLEEFDGDGGVEWDLRDQNGNPVSSGIYLFLATGNGDEKLGKFAVLR